MDEQGQGGPANNGYDSDSTIRQRHEFRPSAEKVTSEARTELPVKTNKRTYRRDVGWIRRQRGHQKHLRQRR
jgi:hypothetical protein